MIKKLISGIIAGVMLFSSTVFAADLNVNLNGNPVEFSNQSPVVVDGRTLIPLRGVFEKIGYSINWDADTKTASLIYGEDKITITAGSSEFFVNDIPQISDVPAQIINASMMLPLRAIGEAAGGLVLWDSDTKTADIFILDDSDFAYEIVSYLKNGRDLWNPLNDFLNEFDETDFSSLDDEDTLIFLERLIDKIIETKEAFEKIEVPNQLKKTNEKLINGLDILSDLFYSLEEYSIGNITEEELENKANYASSQFEEFENYFSNISEFLDIEFFI